MLGLTIRVTAFLKEVNIMDFCLNHDYHIHSQLSDCSSDPLQTAENILKYAEDNNFSEICITDHFWDETVEGASDWYIPQNFKHISKILPLPQSQNVKFYFGCETEMDKYNRIGIADKTMDKFDFIIIPTTHLHMDGFTIAANTYDVAKRAEIFVDRLNALLNMDLPFHKVGIAHLTCPLMSMNSRTSHIELVDLIEDKTFKELFAKAAKVGIGIELNLPYASYSEEELARIMRPYKIAKETGCKFYFGSDAHHPKNFENKKLYFGKMAEYLGLKDSDRFKPF